MNAQCIKPTNVELLNFGFYFLELDISWDGNGMNLWDIEWGNEGFIPTGVPNVEDHLYSYINLNSISIPESQYFDFYVRADCGGTTSDWVGPFTFYKYCVDEFGALYTVGSHFEDTFVPECWMESESGTPLTGAGIYGNSNWEQDIFANNSDNSLSAKINISVSETNNWLILPMLIGLSGFKQEGAIEFYFNIALTEANSTDSGLLGLDDSIQVVISYDFGNTWYVIYSWDSNSIVSNTGDYIEIYHENYSDDGIDMFENSFLIAFYVSSGNNNDANVDFFIDDLFVHSPNTGSVVDLKSKGFTFFPNPSDKFLDLRAKETINQVVLYNSLGQEVKRIEINGLYHQLDISNLPEAVYYMLVRIGNIIGVVPVIKN